MSEVTISLGPVQVPESRLRKIIFSPFRKAAGTSILSHKIDSLEVHIRAMTDVFYIILADLMDKWPSDKRERVLKAIANFTIVNSGLSTIKPQQNPFTADEVARLRRYTEKAQRGDPFLADEAHDFRELSERAAREYPNQQWVAELLKIGLFIFAIYAIGKLLESR